MPKLSEGNFSFDSGKYYVVDFSAALNYPELFDANAPLSERHLIVSALCFQRMIKQFSSKDDDRGESASDLSYLISDIINKGAKKRLNGADEIQLGERLFVTFDRQDHCQERQQFGNIAGENICESLALALYWQRNEATKNKVRVLTNDNTMFLAAHGIFKEEHIIFFNLEAYKGWVDVSDNTELCLRWQGTQKMSRDEFKSFCPDIDLYPHEFVFFCEDTKKFDIRMIGRYDGDPSSKTFGYIVPLYAYKKIRYTKPRNRYQACAIEAEALPPDVCLATIQLGPAGSGKTRIATGVALETAGLLDGKRISASPDGKGSKSGKNGDQGKQKKARAGKPDPDLAYFTPVDINGQPRKIPMEAVPMLVNPEESAPQIAADYDGVIFVPPRQMLHAMPPVPGDLREKNADLLAPYVTVTKQILDEKNDKAPGGHFCSPSDNETHAQRIVEQINVYTYGNISGQNFYGMRALTDEIQFDTGADLNAFIERIDVGGKGSAMGDPSQLTNRYGAAGNPSVRFTRRHARSWYVAVVVYPHDASEQTINNIERPGGKAALFGATRAANY